MAVERSRLTAVVPSDLLPSFKEYCITRGLSYSEVVQACLRGIVGGKFVITKKRGVTILRPTKDKSKKSWKGRSSQ